MAITLQISIFDPMSKMRLGDVGDDSSAICLQFCNKLTPPPEWIFAFPVWSQNIYLHSQPFELVNFDMGHPVNTMFQI